NIAWPKCPTWRSGLVRYPMELGSDSEFDLSGLLSRLFAKRFARGVGVAMTTKLLTDAALGVSAAATGAITSDEIISLIASLDSAAVGQNGAFLMNLQTLASLYKLKGSGGGQYMLDPDAKDA